MTAPTLSRQDVALLVLDTAAGPGLPVDQAFIDGVDVGGMVAACETARLIHRIGTDNGLMFALSRYGEALRNELAEETR